MGRCGIASEDRLINNMPLFHTNAMLVTFIQPAVAVLLGVLFLNESLAPAQLGGMASILAGLALVDGRLPARLLGPRRGHQ